MKFLSILLALFFPLLPVHASGKFFQQLRMLANQGEAESQFILGLTHRDGWDGEIKPGTLVAKWCELAAELGDRRVEMLVGLLQREQIRVLPDVALAERWLDLAARQGDNYARVLLGDMLLEGDGVPADWVRGADWIKRSASSGFAPAQFRLGVIYLVGNDTQSRDEIEALAWFIVAAEAGSESARQFRDEQTERIGLEAARLAVRRSRELRQLKQS